MVCNSKKHLIFLRFYKILLSIHLYLFKYCYFANLFTFMPILTHQISNFQLIIKTNVFNYAFTAILSIMDKNSEVHLVTFYSRTFISVKLNYDAYIRDFQSFLKLLATNIDLDTFFHIILSSNPIVVKHNFTKGSQFINSSSFLFFNSRIFIPSSGNFYTYILQYNQDHILASHFGQNKILELIYYKKIQFFIIFI